MGSLLSDSHNRAHEWGSCFPIHMIVLIRYHHGILLIEKVGTHAEYSKWKLS